MSFHFTFRPSTEPCCGLKLTIPFPFIFASFPDAALLATPETTSTSAVSPEA